MMFDQNLVECMTSPLDSFAYFKTWTSLELKDIIENSELNKSNVVLAWSVLLLKMILVITAVKICRGITGLWVHNTLTTVMMRFIVDKGTDHAKPHSICFLQQYQGQLKTLTQTWIKCMRCIYMRMTQRHECQQKTQNLIKSLKQLKHC